MRTKLLIMFAAMVLMPPGTMVKADGIVWDYSGVLDSTGIVGRTVWSSGSSIAWNVAQVGSNFVYEYTFTVPRKDISHVIIETSDTFRSANFASGPYNGLYDSTTLISADLLELKTTAENGEVHEEEQGNPGLPSPIAGLKINMPEGSVASVLTYSFWFESDKSPVWANAYAKGGVDEGGEVYMYNSKFGDADSFYTKAPTTGWQDITGYVLAPDSGGGTEVPHPGALVGLLSMGCFGLLRKCLRRKKPASV